MVVFVSGFQPTAVSWIKKEDCEYMRDFDVIFSFFFFRFFFNKILFYSFYVFLCFTILPVRNLCLISSIIVHFFFCYQVYLCSSSKQALNLEGLKVQKAEHIDRRDRVIFFLHYNMFYYHFYNSNQKPFNTQ